MIIYEQVANFSCWRFTLYLVLHLLPKLHPVGGGQSMRIDLHVHTRYSGHSLLRPERIVEIARKRNLDALAITDHDEIQGAIEVSRMFPTIIGEEVTSEDGDIIGLFLTEKVQRGSAKQVMESIRAQGGLVIVPHPFDSTRGGAVMSEEVCASADCIEVFNSRVVRKADNERARTFAELKNIPAVVGSDAHTSMEIGKAWMDVGSIDDPKSFLASLRDAKVHTSKSSVAVRVITMLLKVREIRK